MLLSVESMDFLMENRLQNSREWFLAHKAQYQQFVLTPLIQLVEQLYPSLYSIDPKLIIEPKVNRSISRIYRDTRYTRDKSLYREHMWLAFSRDRKEPNCPPAFVFEFWPDGWRFGCGYYYMPPALMQQVRDMALANDKRFLAAQAVLKQHPEYVLEGDTYKRQHYPDYPPDLQLWLNRKDCCLVCNSRDFDLLFSPLLSQTLAKGFAQMQPVYEFLLAASQLYLHQ